MTNLGYNRFRSHRCCNWRNDRSSDRLGRLFVVQWHFGTRIWIDLERFHGAENLLGARLVNRHISGKVRFFFLFERDGFDRRRHNGCCGDGD